ncbi:MAG: WecB/TagA/CpsF family glycosyltransferase [Phyllobacterium sp.]
MTISSPLTSKTVAWREILGVPVAALGWEEALAVLGARIVNGQFVRVGWLNAHNANLMRQNPEYRSVLDEFIILPDGVGVDLASKMLHGMQFPANLNGTDFTPALLQSIAKPLRVGLLGARREAAEMAAGHFKEIAPQHDFRVIADGFFKPADEPRVLADIADYHPDILLVAMGVPRQELFIAKCLTPRHCTAAIAVGALFDLATGAVPRAPVWMRNLRLEWLFRLWQEPGRLWRRYIVGNPLFVLRVLRDRLSGASGGRSA